MEANLPKMFRLAATAMVHLLDRHWYVKRKSGTLSANCNSMCQEFCTKSYPQCHETNGLSCVTHQNKLAYRWQISNSEFSKKKIKHLSKNKDNSFLQAQQNLSFLSIGKGLDVT